MARLFLREGRKLITSRFVYCALSKVKRASYGRNLRALAQHDPRAQPLSGARLWSFLTFW